MEGIKSEILTKKTENILINGEDEVLYRPVLETGKWFFITFAILSSVVIFAAYAYFNQFKQGLGVTGLNSPVFWGIYITNFVFFIGVSHAGTLISAILRISKAEWRRTITRSAEVITVLVLFFGAGNIMIDMGRPDRLMNVIYYGRFQSPLLWDVVAITTYLTASTIYLYIPLIPDIALLRDRVKGIRRRFYQVLALGWRGTEKQVHCLESAITIMAVTVLPIAVSVHTVVSYVFSMTVQPMWHSAIFGPYFVTGAIFSGIASIIIAMAILRKVYHLEEYFRQVHFNNLGILLLVMTCLWAYFTACEYLTVFYGAEPAHLSVFYAKISGKYAPHFWTMIITCFVIPFTLLANNKTRTIKGTLIASISVNIGMWLERYTIVVPTLMNPRMPYEKGVYLPTWVEWSILAGCFALFTMIYMVFTKLFPIVSIWEVQEGREKALDEVGERIRTYLPFLIIMVLSTLFAVNPSFADETYFLPQNPLEGSHLFIKKGCVKCHAIRGYGGVIGPDLGMVGKGTSLLDIAAVMWNHVPHMTKKMTEENILWPKFSGKEMASLIGYLYYLNYFDEPGDPIKGEKIFNEKNCVKCHNLKEGSKKIGPNLSKFNGSYIAMTQAMWNHGPKMITKMNKLGFQMPTFKKNEIIDLLSYVRKKSNVKVEESDYILPGNPNKGRSLFVEKDCIKCHAIRGEGGPIGPDLAEVSEELSGSVSEIVGIMWNHGPKMWSKMKEKKIAFPELSANEMADLIAFLYFIGYFEEKGNPIKGYSLFQEKQCIKCHSIKGKGGGIGPDLAEKTKNVSSPIDLAAKMWDHAPIMHKEVTKMQISWPKLQKGDMANLVSFLDTIKKK